MHVCVMCEGFVCGHSETVEYVWLGGSGSGGVSGLGCGIFGVLSLYGHKHVLGFSNLH